MPRVKTGQPVAPGRRSKGILVVVEGSDGTGKTTIAQGVVDRLAASDVPVHQTTEPTHGPFGKLLRERQAEGRRYTPLEEYWLFMLDRAEHGRTLLPLLAQGKVVVSDRYWHSTWVYQIPQIVKPRSMAQEIDQDIIGEMMTQATGEPYDPRAERRSLLRQDALRVTPQPDLLVVLDLPVETAQERILASRGQLDAFETTELMGQYREDYLRLAELQGGAVLDANRPIESLVGEVHDRIIALREKSLTTL
jgi:dTMP kinase